MASSEMLVMAVKQFSSCLAGRSGSTWEGLKTETPKMTKEQWNKWYSHVYKSLSDIDRYDLDTDDQLQEAIGAGNYYLAEQIVMEMFPDSAWLM